MNHHLLLLRPDDQAHELAQLLQQRARAADMGLTCSSKSMVKISGFDDPNHSLRGILQQPWDAGMMVSVNAARHFAKQAAAWAPEQPMPSARWYAVGPTSAAAIAQVVGRPVNCPWRQHNSDALLRLPELQQVKGQRWLLIRGHGGRELVADTLRARGADVTYLEVYQRTPVSLAPNEFEQWQQQVNGIVVTSAEQLSYFLAAVPRQALSWLANCYWIVASDRLKQLLPVALQGNVAVAHSATPFALVDAWQQLLEQQ
ncbi:uroporphyrinogen-III synthase [Pseudidiomarina tainanensis]|uniref:Uroporphyrinogen-III synthase n=1 Tax=Pseudidiomarina tainanensis TaxID=502365 RepID=A0ACD2HHE1_9GAMM|nr:uroporphyrinogen-III synthase [Pseudidiomarina tainanensis]RZQ55714.1 uroporphyrinogen-III synthase [Pseudidiomarina tainanensis]